MVPVEGLVGWLRPARTWRWVGAGIGSMSSSCDGGLRTHVSLWRRRDGAMKLPGSCSETGGQAMPVSLTGEVAR